MENNIRLKRGSLGNINWIGVVLLWVIALIGTVFYKPGYSSWAILSAGVILVMMFHFCEEIIARRNRLVANPAHWLTLGLGLVIAWHIFSNLIGGVEKVSLRGAIDSSMIFQLGIISAGVLVVSSLICTRKFETPFRLVSGLILAVVPAICNLAKSGLVCSEPLMLCSLAGALTWLSGLIKKREIDSYIDSNLTPLEKIKQKAGIAVGLIFIIFALMGATLAGFFLLIGAVVVTCAIYLAVRFGKSAKSAWLVGGVCFVALVGTFCAISDLEISILGAGETGFAYVTARNAGSDIVLATTGLVGMCVVCAVLVCSLIRMMLWEKSASKNLLLRNALGGGAFMLACFAMLSPAGYSMPAVTVAIIITGGLITVGRTQIKPLAKEKSQDRNPLLLLAPIMGILLVAGMSASPGLFTTTGRFFGLGDKGLHYCAGFFVSLALAWAMGAKRFWLGFVGLFAGALIGAAGEIIQKNFTSNRGAEFADFYADLWGSASATVVYLISLLGRWSTQVHGQKAWRRVSGRYYTGWCFRILLGIVIALPGVALSLKSVEYAGNLIRENSPGLVIGDALPSTSHKKYYLRGIGIGHEALSSCCVMVQDRDNNLVSSSWNNYSKGHRLIYPLFAKNKKNDHDRSIAGRPFSCLAYLNVKNFRYHSAAPSDKILVLDSADIVAKIKSGETEMLAGWIAKIRRAGWLITAVDKGPIEKFIYQRTLIKSRFPKIYLICDPEYRATKKAAPRRFTLPQKQSYHASYFVFRMISKIKYKKVYDPSRGIKVTKVDDVCYPTFCYVGSDRYSELYFQHRYLKRYRGYLITDKKFKTGRRFTRAKSLADALEKFYSKQVLNKNASR